MAQLLFGPGVVWGERVDNQVLDPVTKKLVPVSGTGPTQFGITQKASVNWSFTDKPLYGQLQFPVAVARGQGKVDVKITNAQFNMLLFSDLFFGLTPTLGQFSIKQSEVITIAGGYTVINSGAGVFLEDLGVRDNTTGNHFQRITPVGFSEEYSVDVNGAYSFSGADSGREVVISYAYHLAPTATNNNGLTLSITNQSQGFTPAWKCTFFQQTSPGQAGANTSDQPLALRLNACVSSKLTLPNSAIDSWTIPEMDAMAFSNAAGEIGVLSMVQR